jgi:preprotein translocase subunit SecG
MHEVILTVHVLVVLGVIGVVLLQRSEGGALGMGGGPGGGFMTSRGTANLLTRTTSILAAIFFATSITLAMTADRGATQQDVIENLTGEKQRDPNAPITTEDFLDTLGSDRSRPATAGEAAPASQQPSSAPVLEAAPATAEPTPDAQPAGETPADAAPAGAAEPAAPQ